MLDEREREAIAVLPETMRSAVEALLLADGEAQKKSALYTLPDAARYMIYPRQDDIDCRIIATLRQVLMDLWCQEAAGAIRYDILGVLGTASLYYMQCRIGPNLDPLLARMGTMSVSELDSLIDILGTTGRSRYTELISGYVDSEDRFLSRSARIALGEIVYATTGEMPALLEPLRYDARESRRASRRRKPIS